MDKPKQPGQDIAPPPPTEKIEAKPVEQPVKPPAENAAAEQPLPEQPAPQKPKQAKQPGNHVGLAIVATIIIVLGLAALATFAFLQPK